MITEKNNADVYQTIMQEALEAYFRGAIKQCEVKEFTCGIIKQGKFTDELDRLTCHHPLCTESTPCRAGKRRNGGTFVCTALVDTEFDDYCPFYQTAEQFRDAFLRTYAAEKPILGKHGIKKVLAFSIPKNKLAPVGKKSGGAD